DTYSLWRGKTLKTPVFNDVLTPLEGTEVLAEYANSYYAGSAALTEHQTGAGRVLHFGSAFSRDNIPGLLEYADVVSPFSELIEAEGREVELTLRQKDGRTFLFVLNFNAEEAAYVLKKKMVSLFDEQEAFGRVSLPGFGTAVYEVR
ncbi:MAG: beta-galactosidase trimerization domain-containing protein, partial [Lachnospiraceae bacterium]|nr:beta-galactosidase trimerization domain-containing protein [Lachnospiraceae bacterium]